MSGRLFFEFGHRPVTAAIGLRQKGSQVLNKSSAYNKSANAPAELFETPVNASGAPAWKQEVNERLAAHRNRRGGNAGPSGEMAESPKTASARAAAAAARVAARYAKAPSYSELLADEARAVVRAAGQAAEAARSAQAAAQAVLTGLEFGPGNSEFWEPQSRTHMEASAAVAEPVAPVAAPSRWQDEPPVVSREREMPWAGAQPRWEEALPVHTPAAGADVWSEMRLHPSPKTEARHEYSESHDDGELFSEGSYGAAVEPVQHIAANLIEFPRELVATRKARPRLAEGPLYDASLADAQLSIFEVDPDLLPAPVVFADPHAVAPPEWASIRLDHATTAEYQHSHNHETAYEDHAEHFYAATPQVGADYADASPAPTYHVETLAVAAQHAEAKAAPAWNSVADEVERTGQPEVELLVAPFSDRLLAGLVDGALVTLAFLAAAVVVIASTEHPPSGKIALVASICGLALFGMLYQFLFLSYAEEGTPGMRYARIALCTFDDDNPTREQMRKRIPALLLSMVPAGLGLIWAAVDGENLGWHDRLTRTYQRKY
jgi:uncharacterized RDD family membrane protein YckC